VDNGSDDESPAIIRREAGRHPARGVLLLSSEAPGAAATLNIGIRAAAGDVIIRLDGHSIPAPDYVERCLARLQDPGAGVVGGVWEVMAGAGTRTAQAIAVAVSSPLGTGGAAYRDRGAAPAARDADTVPFGAFRRALWETIGGYDESLQVVEDGDFNFRVRQAGYRVILDPAIHCTYYARRDFRALAHQYFRYGWWKIALFRKHPGAVRLRQIVPLAFVTVAVLLAIACPVARLARVAFATLVSLYAVTLLVEAARIAVSRHAARLWPLVAAAYGVIHLSWGLGGLTSLVTFGRWPQWRAR
jgi:GT2 family glycosyltransferase